MRFKTTIILSILFLALLAGIYFFESKDKSGKETEKKLVALNSEEVEKIVFKKQDETLTFQKDKQGDWFIIQPLEAKADKFEVDRIADDFSDLKIERAVEEEAAELEKYGIPQKEISLYFKDKEQPVTILIGMENPLDNTFFAKREGESRVVLISSSLKSLLEKGIFDFRQKDIFNFETDDARELALRARDIQWEAQKTEEEWVFKNPVKALAEKSKIDSILRSLSGLRAKEFVAEEKKDEDKKKYGLLRPDYEIAISLPKENKKVTFSLQKKEDKVYATTSLSSKIIEVGDSVLFDLKKETQELREKKVADFYSWEANRLQLKIRRREGAGPDVPNKPKDDSQKNNAVPDSLGGPEYVDITVYKVEEGNWFFETPEKKEANKSKIEAFIRKTEGLEAADFIDPPLKLEDYGLDKPQAEVKIWVKEDEEKIKEITILIGNEVAVREEEKETKEEEEEKKETRLVVVKNARLDYLFKVDSAFLGEFPNDIKDWHKEGETEGRSQ